MIFSLIIFIWLQKSGGLTCIFFKVEGLKPPAPPLPTPMNLNNKILSAAQSGKNHQEINIK